MGNAGKAGQYISKTVLTDADGKALKAGTDYEKHPVYTLDDGTVLETGDSVPVNTFVHVTVTAKGNYEGTLEAVYRVAEKSFSKASIKISAKPAYTGQAVCLDEKSITVRIGKEYLQYGKDYMIDTGSYKSNINKGKASVVIRGIGKYGGSKTVSYSIQSKIISW